MGYQPSSSMFCTILIFSCIISSISLALASSQCNSTRTFIISECNATHFSKMCITSLSPFACKISYHNRQQLCEAALRVTSSTAVDAWKLLSNVYKEESVKANKTEAGAISGCMANFGHVVDDMNIASRMMKNKVTNQHTLDAVKEFVIAYTGFAMADEKRCLAKLDRAHVRADTRKKIYAAVLPALKLKMITLALVKRI